MSSADILNDLDLLDDWLAGKGYGEEAGLVLRAMTLINAQARELRELRAAMHDIYEVYAGSEGIPLPETCAEAYLYGLMREMVKIAAKHKRAAALKETDNG